MSTIINRIKTQIKRDGKLPEHLEVLKLYNLMITYPSLKNNMLWNLLTTFDSKSSTYSVKPEFKKLIVEFNKL